MFDAGCYVTRRYCLVNASKISKRNTNVPKFVAVWVRGSVHRYLCIYYSGMSVCRVGMNAWACKAFVNIGFPLCRDLLVMYVQYLSIDLCIYPSIHPSIHPSIYHQLFISVYV